MSRKITSLSLLLLALVGIAPAASQNLNDYLRIAAENNPDLKARFTAYRAALEKMPQVGALPDPQVSFNWFLQPMERYVGNQVAEISAMQMFPWFGTLRAAKAEAAAMAKARYEAFREAKTMVFYEVKTTWYALYLLEKELAITGENIRILQTLEGIAIHRFKSGGMGGAQPSGGRPMEKPPGSSGASGSMGGDMPGPTAPGEIAAGGDWDSMEGMGEMSSGGRMVDVLRVQLEINELNNKLALLGDSRRLLLAEFNRLLNRPSGEAFLLPDSLGAATLPVSLAQIPDTIRRNNPLIAMLEKEEEALLAQENMNRKMGFPMIGVGLQYSVFQPRAGGESMMNGQNMWMPMATINTPLWRKKYHASVQEAGLMREAVIEQQREASNRLWVGYEEALKEDRDAERRGDLYQRQASLAQQALDILTMQYATTGSAFEEVMRMQQQWLNYRLQGLDAMVDQQVAIAMLERLMGR